MRKTLYLVVAVVLVAALIFTGCGAKTDAKSANSQEAWRVGSDGTVVFSVHDNSASTGYAWSYEISNPEVLEYVKDEVIAANDAAPGASAVREYTFKAKAAGGTTLVFAQSGPSGATDGDKLTYQITVGEKNAITVG